MSVKGNRTKGNQTEKSSYKDDDTLYNLDPEDDNNLYTLPEDDSEDDDIRTVINHEDSFVSREETSYGRDEGDENYDDGEEEDDEDEEEDDDSKDNEGDSKDKVNTILLMIKILSTPVEGCKELKRRRLFPETVMTGCFIPMTFLAALSEFAAKLYGTYITWGECMMKALVTFVSFFFGYFTVILIGASLLPKGARHIMKSDAGRNFLMICFSTLCLFFMAMNLLPMLDAILVFLPIWTIYIIYKGVRFLRVPRENESRIKIVLSFLVIGTPFLWNWLLEIFFNI
ncbi:MAG: YIP1 family protein [Muribaculaceae bacterium]|nr:YIP1 family protein [Muribaculaceae bacterium]